MAEQLDEFPDPKTWPDEWFNGKVWRLDRQDLRLRDGESLTRGVNRVRAHARRVHGKSLETATDRSEDCAYIRAYKV